MSEFFQFCFSSANIIPSVLLILVLLYWIIVILGILDIDAFDADVDIDLDADVDLDVDTDLDVDVDGDAHVGASGSVMWINSVLSFFNLGKVPVMIVFSFFALPLWVITLAINDLLGIENFFLSLLVLLPAIVVSLMISKVLTMPFVKVFKKGQQVEKNEGLTGKICTVLLHTTHSSFGQASLHVEGDQFTINVVCPEGIEMDKGDQGLVIDYNAKTKIYLIEPYKSN